ncbi:MAG: amidophosphoribosyltransferase [Dehalococcoidia bacterium]
MIPSLREKCGVFGVYAPAEDVARLTFFGLFALQHRGQEAAGIATTDGEQLFLHAEMGLVTQIFTEEVLASLPGRAAIGHTRYSTTGSSVVENCQPLLVGGDGALDGAAGQLLLAHNGNIVNAEELRDELLADGVSFKTTTDSEVIAQLIARAPGEGWGQRFGHMMERVRGAYSLTVLTRDALFALRDPNGIRPLCIGRLEDGYVVASETCALDHLGADFVREVEPGEVVRVDDSGLTSHFPLGREPARPAPCVFEYIYFARPDSELGGDLLHTARVRMGRELAREHPAEGDLVIGVPDSGTRGAIGYSLESGIPYAEGLIQNRYVGRTFIEPDQRLRELGVQLKLNPLRALLEGKRIVVVDDTIVRGTTNPPVVAMLRKAGATEVHMRIHSPPVRYPCFYGIDMATREELIGAQRSVEEIRRYIGADSLGYLSLAGLLTATKRAEETLCMGCLSGSYPGEVPFTLDKLALEENGARERSAAPLPLSGL